MKKITTFLLISLFSSFLFAKQPFFLQNWIIPEDFVWSANKNLPDVPGKRFFQRMSDKYVVSYVSFYRKNLSNLEFPPYFEENNLLSWNKTYEQIIQAFENNELFFTHEYVYPNYDAENLSNGISFLDIIRIVCRQDNYFEIEVYFEHTATQEERNEQTPRYCYINYRPKGLAANKTNIPQNEVFENEYRTIWEENSPEEKAIILLSYMNARDYKLLPAKYDCTLTENNTKADPVSRLKTSYSIKDKQGLLEYIKNPDAKTIIPSYEDCKQDMEKYTEESIIEIAEKENYSVPGISWLFFIDSMSDYIGKNGIEIYTKARVLMALRLGAGAGFITREESVEYAKPIVNQLLNEYVSFQDFTAHYAASQSFLGVTKSSYAKWPADIMKLYNDVNKFLPVKEIEFSGSLADTPLLFDDAYYKPKWEALWWSKVQREYENQDGKELASVKYAISMFGKLLCLEHLLEKIRPVKYDSSKSENPEAFFNKNYKQIWDNLPENEKYAIAFSSNLFELNRQYHLDFDNLVTLCDDSSSPKALLKDSWGIENKEKLLETFNSLEAYGQSGAYKSLSDLLDKYPDKTPVQIALAENLSVLETSRLNFVKDTRSILGEHGIEAWDEGREITILRWGISCDYISSNEAMKLIVPVINRIRQNYVSFEDYICHYIIGRQFYGLYSGDYERLAKNSINAAKNTSAYIPVSQLSFGAQKADVKHVMNYSECVYSPSESFLEWEKVMALYRQNESLEILEMVERLEEEKPEYSNILFSWHLSMLNNLETSDEVVNFIENNFDYLEKLPKDNNTYVDSMYYYIRSLNSSYNPQKALTVYFSLPDSLQGNIYYYYQYAYANFLMINLSNNQSELEYYQNTARAAFSLLKEYNFTIGERLEGWLKAFER